MKKLLFLTPLPFMITLAILIVGEAVPTQAASDQAALLPIETTPTAQAAPDSSARPVQQPTAKPTLAEPAVIPPTATVVVDTSKTPLAEQCDTQQCQTLMATYALEGIYGYTSDRYVQQVQVVLEAYARLLGSGDVAVGQARFKQLVTGPNGLQRIEFVEELRSGRQGHAYARFAPEAPPEVGAQNPDVYAIWCGAEQMLGPCQLYAVPVGTILVDVSTREHVAELPRTLAHEITHALDWKTGLDARTQFEASGAASAAPEVGGSLQEQFAETVALWLFPRTGTPAADWDPTVGAFITSYFGQVQ